MSVENVMVRSVHSCRQEDSLATAAKLMWENDIGSVPVVDAAGRPIAMVTDRDICMAAYTRGRPLFEIRVSEAMSRSIHAMRTNQSLQAAEDLMQNKQIRRAPVVDDSGRLVGILSLNDLAQVSADKARGRETDSVPPEVLTSTLASICRPRMAT